MGQYVDKTALRPRVISIPWLCDAMVCAPKLSYKREDLYAICNHGQCFPLGHTIISMKEVTRPLQVAHHQGVPVAITVKDKVRTTGLLGTS